MKRNEDVLEDIAEDNSMGGPSKLPNNNAHYPHDPDVSAEQLQKFLSQFYLIRTPYGYILGRNYSPGNYMPYPGKSKRTSRQRRNSNYGE